MLVIKFICILRRVLQWKWQKKRASMIGGAETFRCINLHFCNLRDPSSVFARLENYRYNKKKKEGESTYLLETAIHDSDLLAGELGLPQKLLYRHRPGGLLPRPRVLEFEERLFRSRRVRRRRHDLWFCRRLKLLKAAHGDEAVSPRFRFLSVYIRCTGGARLSHHRRYHLHPASHRALPFIVSLPLRFFLSFLRLSKRKKNSLFFSLFLKTSNKLLKIFPTRFRRARANKLYIRAQCAQLITTV